MDNKQDGTFNVAVKPDYESFPSAAKAYVQYGIVVYVSNEI
jgi:hypothetical protein